MADGDFTVTQFGPGKQLGPYRIEAPLGAGGMGEVFRARDTRLHRTVAIKILPRAKVADSEQKRRFLQEARAASALNHPHIVVLHDISHDAGTDFLVLEYVQGKTLKELIAAKALLFPDVLRYGVQAAGALAAAHAAGVVHRDIKPANIMITRDSQVKILDFGLAKLSEPPAGADTVTEHTTPGTVMGTVAYMSPEQARGEQLDGRSDIFSLGSVLYEAATGVPAFRGATALATLHQITAGELRAPSLLRPDLPPAFDQIIFKCLRKDAAQRFQTMAGVAAAFQQIAGGGDWVSAQEKPSIAVLPFANMSGDPDNEYFSDGLAEDVINALTQIEGFRVTARTSAFALRGRALDVREIGRALNVGAVLEGSVRRSGNRLRITAQLVNVADGYHLWSERYDREMTDVFEIQDEISSNIVEKLRPRLLGKAAGAGPVLAPKRHTEDPEAYSLYLKGRYQWNKRVDVAEYWRAIECFEQAVARDPGYALAYAGLADAYSLLGGWETGVLAPAEAHRKSREYAEQALRLDPDLPEAHAALGFTLLHFAWDLAEAENRFRDAIRLNPKYGPAHHIYSHVLIAAGRFEESLAESRKYLEVEPADPLPGAHLCWHYVMAGQPDQAIAHGQRAMREDPHFPWNHLFLGWGLLDGGSPAEALAEIETALDISKRQPVILGCAAHALAVNGRREEALRMLDELKDNSEHRYVDPFAIGLVHEAVGNREEAFRYWEQAFEERSPWLVYLTRESRLRHLRGEPRFDAFLAKVRQNMRGVALS